MAAAPQVAVVVATRDRAGLLAELLDSLAEQTFRDFEVVVVDDGSTDDTQGLLTGRDDLPLRVLRAGGNGPARARDAGWRASAAPLVAFTDDDCTVVPRWLEALVGAHAARPGSVVQGPTDPDPAEAGRQNPFTRSITVHEPGPPYHTCNILYPREVLERIDGFDLSFPLPGGEDTDLGWRAEQSGAPVIWAREAQAHHAVIRAGAAANLRYALRWEHTIPVFARHPALRRAQLHRGVFWSPTHEMLLGFLAAVALTALAPPRARPLALVLAAPYLKRLTWRRSGPVLAPYLLAYDLVEVYAVIRGALRARVLVL